MESTLIESIQKSLHPASHKEGEAAIKAMSANPAFLTLLLSIINSNLDASTRLAASILLKNNVKSLWPCLEDDPHKVSASDRELLKSRLVPLLVSKNITKPIRNQISEIIHLVALVEFPDNWSSFMIEVVEFTKTGDSETHDALLDAMSRIFERYTHEFRSNALFYEINYVMEHYAPVYLTLFQTIDQKLSSGDNSPLLVSSLLSLVKIYYYLSFQDLPAFFEENLNVFMTLLHKYLGVPGLEEVKEVICDIVNLYLSKYEEEFQMLPAFIDSIWNVLMSLTMDSKYDRLAGHAISILASISKHARHVKLLQNDQILQNICEKIVLPNMQIREADEEVYEDDPLDYVKKTMEGGDSESRRRAATDLVRGLLEHFESQLSPLFLNYIQNCLKAADWKLHDTAIQLFISVAMKGSLTQHGVSLVNKNVNIDEFFVNHCVGYLKDARSHPMLKSTVLFFALIFRNQLSASITTQIYSILLSGLQSNDLVVQIYAAACLDKYITSLKLLLKEFGEPVAISLMQILAGNPKARLTEYIVKALWKVYVFDKDLSLKRGRESLEKLISFIQEATLTSVDARYNHYLFECVAIILRHLDEQSVSQLESVLFPVLLNILQQDITDFVPYVFQVLAYLLGLHYKKGIPESFKPLLTPLLQPTLWETMANVPGLVKMLNSFVMADPAFIAKEYLNPYLGLFQKMIGSKSYDHFAFQLITSICLYLPASVLQSVLPSVFISVFQRLQKDKTPKFTHNLVLFLSEFLLREDEDACTLLVKTVDSIQPNLFGMLIKSVVLEELPKTVHLNERRLNSAAFSKLLGSLPNQYAELQPLLLEAVIKGLPESAVADDENLLEEDEQPIQAVSFSRLSSISTVRQRKLVDPKALVVQMGKQHGNLVMRLSNESQERLRMLAN